MMFRSKVGPERSPVRELLVFAAVVSVALAPLASSSGQAFLGRQAAPSLDGENALYVIERGDTVEVRWLTTEPVSGFLEVRAAAEDRRDKPPESADGETTLEFVTSQARIHSAVFQRPSSGPLRLIYGTLGSETDRYETTVWPTPCASCRSGTPIATS